MKKRINHFDQHASSCLLAVQWTVPPYEIFRFTFPSISTLCLSTFICPLCTVTFLTSEIRYHSVYSCTSLFCFTTCYVKLYLMEVMFSFFYCKFIIGHALIIVNAFLKNDLKNYLIYDGKQKNI